jgi:hypothetical protein
MKRVLFRASVTVALLGGWLPTGRTVHADSPPKAEELLDKFITATGGKEAYEKCKNRVSKGTMEIKPLGVKGKVTVYEATPNKRYLEAELPGIGKIEEGTDGKTVWEKNALSGARIKEGAEKASSLQDAQFDADLNWRKAYKKVEYQGEEAVDGKPAHKVVLTPSESPARTAYYDKASNLLVKVVLPLKTAMGEIKTEAFLSDYKKVDGLLIPHRLRQLVAGQEIVITLDTIEQNAKLPENRFDLPEDIKKLAKEPVKDGK